MTMQNFRQVRPSRRNAVLGDITNTGPIGLGASLALDCHNFHQLHFAPVDFQWPLEQRPGLGGGGKVLGSEKSSLPSFATVLAPRP